MQRPPHKVMLTGSKQGVLNIYIKSKKERHLNDVTPITDRSTL